MNTPNDGGPAFPMPDAEVLGGVSVGHKGMSLRDYFAAAALAALTAAPDYSSGPADASMARRAFSIADFMIAERNKVVDSK